MITDHTTLTRIATALDGCVNMYGKPLSEDIRAVIFEALDDPTGMNWRAARTCMIGRMVNLWDTVNQSPDDNSHPGVEEILHTLETHSVKATR